MKSVHKRINHLNSRAHDKLMKCDMCHKTIEHDPWVYRRHFFSIIPHIAHKLCLKGHKQHASYGGKGIGPLRSTIEAYRWHIIRDVWLYSLIGMIISYFPLWIFNLYLVLVLYLFIKELVFYMRMVKRS